MKHTSKCYIARALYWTLGGIFFVIVSFLLLMLAVVVWVNLLFTWEGLVEFATRACIVAGTLIVVAVAIVAFLWADKYLENC